MSILLSFVFFISGASALVFETLWFRMVGLTFGNSVWASSLVLSSFMGGLALGNAIAARYGSRIRRPILAYALLECLVGVVGCLLVLLLPEIPEILAPVFRPFLNRPYLLNPTRFGLAFLLLLIPTTAMGVTLPLMVKALNQWSPGFGKALGRLYGVNTIGAMTGAIVGEWLFLPLLGVAGSSVAAALLNIIAALGALWAYRFYRRSSRPHLDAVQPDRRYFPFEGDLLRLLLAAMLSGAILLALEVVWFRFLQLFVLSTTRGFAILLLVVLLGIGAGGLVSALWLRLQPQAYRFISHLAIVAGLLTMWSYIGFEGAPSDLTGSGSVAFFDTLALCLRLMLPVSFASGLLFTFLGRAVFDSHKEETRAVGWVTLFNTVGAALGALVGGWALLPGLGIERSIFALALAYGALAFLVPASLFAKLESRKVLATLILLIFIYSATSLFFPFGLMKNHFVPLATARWRQGNTKIVEFREGLTETIVYLQSYWLGEPYTSRLVTNRFSMTGLSLQANRYMKYFAYWPLAFHPRVEKALLISYGLGITAEALTQAPEIEKIDIVDISKDIIAMGEVVYPDPVTRPLNDPRVNVFIEDGRFFLLVNDERYDLITAEPPPLAIAGVVNLYTQEYFQLIKDRLTDGGYATYWLPVVQLSPSASRSIIKAFCNVFEDCSLWRGARLDLVLVGSRNASERVDEENFKRMWKNPKNARELQIIGIEVPELLLSTFVGDASYLRQFTQDRAPLVDNYPHRLSRDIIPREKFNERVAFYADMVKKEEVARRYRESAFLKRRLPQGLFESGLAFFPYQSIIERCLDAYPNNVSLSLEDLDQVLTGTKLRTPALWLMGDLHEFSGVIESLVGKNVSNETVLYHLGLREMASRNYLEAEEHFRNAQDLGGGNPKIYYYRILALAYANRLERAQEVVNELAAKVPMSVDDEEFWKFCHRRFGLERSPTPGDSTRGDDEG